MKKEVYANCYLCHSSIGQFIEKRIGFAQEPEVHVSTNGELDLKVNIR